MSTTSLARLEAVIDTAEVVGKIESLLPVGVRPRQLRIRTLLLGMLLVACDGRPCHLRRVHHALTGLPGPDQHRLGIITRWRKTGWHRLTYRQTERTFALVTTVLAKDTPDGTPTELLSWLLDKLLEASIQICGEPASSSYAVDWTDLETWARPPHSDGRCADPDAAFGHRNTNHPARNEIFFGYYLQALTTVSDEHGPHVPELVRRLHITGCQHDPPQQIVPVIERMHHDRIPISDVLADSGYAYRTPEHWALPIRRLGISLIVDLHPNDRGPKGTHHGAITRNGQLYCPATPTTLLELAPLPAAADTKQTAIHDRHCTELATYKLGRLTAPDPDGYHRASCPATQGKLRCPLKPASLTQPYDRPTIATPPQHPPVCCTQTTITVPASINAKTAQKHDYPSPEHRASYNRRTAAERVNASIKDPATTNLARGFCRLTNLAAIALFTATTIIARNLRTADTHATRQAEHQRRPNDCRPARRRRRQHTIEQLLAAANGPP